MLPSTRPRRWGGAIGGKLTAGVSYSVRLHMAISGGTGPFSIFTNGLLR